VTLAFRESASQVTLHLGGDPAEINRGSCDEWANAMADLVGGYGLWLDTIWEDVAHCVLVLNGRYYDAAHLDGIDDITYWEPAGGLDNDHP
jgi:hypothetical protein